MTNHYTITYIAYPFKNSDLYFIGQVLVSAETEISAKYIAENRLVDANDKILYRIINAKISNTNDTNKIYTQEGTIMTKEIINQIANLIIEASLEAEEQDLDIPRHIAEVLVTHNIIKDNLTLSSFVH